MGRQAFKKISEPGAGGTCLSSQATA
jgi:hypothetical protein